MWNMIFFYWGSGKGKLGNRICPFINWTGKWDWTFGTGIRKWKSKLEKGLLNTSILGILLFSSFGLGFFIISALRIRISTPFGTLSSIFMFFCRISKDSMDYYISLQSTKHRDAWTSLIVLIFTKLLKLDDERVSEI